MPKLVKVYPEAVFIRAPRGTMARIERERGDRRQADFLRDLLLAYLDRAERERLRRWSHRHG